MAFEPIQIKYKNKRKLISKTPLVTNFDDLKSQLISSLPQTFDSEIKSKRIDYYIKAEDRLTNNPFKELS